ncbi:MAG: peptidoglycan DD-metalloendopeptidase family protein [Rhodobacteraceae bacterium]|nr:peptidoglycan DD-metalloendopeptidase family protein [Paracoccaceae bacterium]
MLSCVPLAGVHAATEVVPDAVDPEIQAALNRKKEREEELNALSRNIKVSQEWLGELEQEIQSLDRDRETLNRRVISTTDTIKNLETQLTDAERRLSRLGGNEDEIRASLKRRRGVLSEVLAALQRIGRQPPPALAVQPKDALAAVRSAILLNAVMPELRVETEALARDLAELTRLKSEIASERTQLVASATRLEEEKSRLELLMRAKAEERDKTAGILAEEKAKAQELAGKAESLKDLIGQIETEIKSARVAAEKARAAEEKAKRRQPDNTDPFSDPGRLAPAVSFASTKSHLPLPVSGDMVSDYGQEDEFGSVTQGQSFVTRAGSTVSSPADGWVVYAGPFRSFGQLLILNAGGGYHVLLAGMDRIDAQLGQFVLAGEPVGAMGTTTWASASTVGLESSQPTLYIEFRKDGTAVDPTPWWDRNENEKVRG